MKSLICWTFIAFFALPIMSFAGESPKDPELTIEEHLLKLSKEDIDVRWTHPSMKALRREWSKSIPLLIGALHEKDSFGQKLYRMVYTNAPSVVTSKLSPPRTQELTDLRVAAAQALAVMGPKAKSAIPELIASLSDINAMNMAFYALTEIGPRNEDAPALIELIKEHQDPDVRGYAVHCLMLTEPTEENFKIVKSCIEDSDNFVRSHAISAAAFLTNSSNVMLPFLIRRLTDQDRINQASAAQAIWKLTKQTNEVLPFLQQTIKDGIAARPKKDRWPSKPVIGLLLAVELSGDIGKQAAPLIPLIEDLYRASALADSSALNLSYDFEPQINSAAAVAIWKIGGKTNLVLKSTRPLLNHSDLNVRWKVAKLLAEFYSEQNQDKLLRADLLAHRDISVQVYGALALWKLKGFDEQLLPILIEGLQDYYTLNINRELRELSAIALGEMGSKAKAAVPALEGATDDGEPKVEAAAKAALLKIKNSGN